MTRPALLVFVVFTLIPTTMTAQDCTPWSEWGTSIASNLRGQVQYRTQDCQTQWSIEWRMNPNDPLLAHDTVTFDVRIWDAALTNCNANVMNPPQQVAYFRPVVVTNRPVRRSIVVRGNMLPGLFYRCYENVEQLRVSVSEVSLAGTWSGPFRDQTDGFVHNGRVTPTFCEGTLRFRLRQAGRSLSGDSWRYDPQRCRWAGEEWYDSPFGDMEITSGGIDGDEVWLTIFQRLSQRALDCDVRARFQRDTLTGTYSCRWSGSSWVSEGEFTVTREN